MAGDRATIQTGLYTPCRSGNRAASGRPYLHGESTVRAGDARDFVAKLPAFKRFPGSAALGARCPNLSPVMHQISSDFVESPAVPP